MDACAGNVTDVCKIGQELLMSVRNFSQCTTGSNGVDMSLADTGRLVEVCFNDVTPSVEMIFDEVGAINRGCRMC